VEQLKHDVFENPELEEVRSDLRAIAEAPTLLWNGKIVRLLAILNSTAADQS
jgi:hypothetical protein